MFIPFNSPSHDLGGFTEFIAPGAFKRTIQNGARAKGNGDIVGLWNHDPLWVLGRHALRNALVPMATVVGLQVGLLLGGSVITETVFGYPGVGQLIVSAISARDTPLVQACVLVTASGFILVNLLVDVSYVLIDPRIRLR